MDVVVGVGWQIPAGPCVNLQVPVQHGVAPDAEKQGVRPVTHASGGAIVVVAEAAAARVMSGKREEKRIVLFEAE